VLPYKREEGIEVGGGGRGAGGRGRRETDRQREREKERGIERERINRLTVCVF
jgi:hypothetical protein